MPQINMAHTDSLIRGNLSVAGLVTKYLHNPDRDYTGLNTGGSLDLTNAAHQLSNVLLLSVRGTYRFTPAMTGFGAAGGGLGTGFGPTSGGVLETGYSDESGVDAAVQLRGGRRVSAHRAHDSDSKL